MRVCVLKNTNELIESQSGGEGQKDLDVLINNAFNNGYTKDVIEAKYVTSGEYLLLLAAQPKTGKQLLLEQKQADINNILPSWNEVETAIDNIVNLADAKSFIKKLTRVVYWNVKNKLE